MGWFSMAANCLALATRGIGTPFKNQHLDCFQKCAVSYEITFMEMIYKLKPGYLPKQP